ncbi:hypothetical protein BD779DRAFT_1575010 [Infundibulicybe gibba]|nr:hypothetical protein BD779DRAFT_1575010 [Infundibulicybe gibba]
MISIRKCENGTTGRLNIALKEGVDVAAFITRHGLKPERNFDYINMFAGRFDEATIKILQQSPDVVYIEEDPIAYLCGTPRSKAAEAK